MRNLLAIVILLIALAATGCNQIQKLSWGSGDEDKASAPQKIEQPKPSASADDSQDDGVPKAEDAQSRQRRDRARASLGMGSK